MSGHGDQRAERILARTVADGPRDVLGLLEALRAELPGILAGQEGAVHLLVHRMLRDGRLRVVGRSEAGLARYAAPTPEEGAPPAAATDGGLATAGRTATHVAKAARNPAARERLAADIDAHLAALAAADAAARFGRPKSWHAILQRVDRGKPAVVLPASGGDRVRRFVLHEGPWILGAALVFLVLKFFVVSPFKIPSESMLPTLETGDRVAVFTLFQRGVPERFAVTVFERDGIHYVKRLIGLPGEEIALWHGDVYIDGALLRKPPALVAALRSPVGHWTFGEVVPAGFAHDEIGGLERWWWRSGRFEADPRGSMSFGMHDGFAVLEGTRAPGGVLELVLAHGPSGTRAEAAGWVLRADDAGVELMACQGLDLTAGVAPEVEEVLAHVAGPAPTGALRLELAFVDGELRARGGGLEHVEPVAAPGGDLSVGLGASPGAGPLTLALDRDHHYSTPHEATHGTPVHGERRAHRIPAGHVFFLGDNTTNSRDSRFSPVGDIPVEAIVGPVSVRIWPPTRWGLVE